MKNEVEYCEVTGKFKYSQAKAERAKNKYKDIRRSYFCEHCEGWHTTSVGKRLASLIGIKVEENEGKVPSLSKIQKRMKYLGRKIKSEPA